MKQALRIALCLLLLVWPLQCSHLSCNLHPHQLCAHLPQAGGLSAVPASLPAAAALAAGVAAPTASLLGRGAAPHPIVPSSLAAAVAIASGAPPAAPHDQALPLGPGLGFGLLPAPPLAPPALPLGAMPDVWQLLGSSLAHCGVPPPSAAYSGVLSPPQGPSEDGFYLCKFGAADWARAGAEGGAARASAAPAEQQGTTVAYVCQAIQLPPTGARWPWADARASHACPCSLCSP